MDYSRYKLFESQVAKTICDNRWLKIETIESYDGKDYKVYNWIKADRIPNYKRLKVGDSIEYSYIDSDERPVERWFYPRSQGKTYNINTFIR